MNKNNYLLTNPSKGQRRNPLKPVTSFVAAACLIISLAFATGCSAQTDTSGSSASSSSTSESSSSSSSSSSESSSSKTSTKDTSDRTTIVSDASVMDSYDWTFSDRDQDPSYDEATATKIVLSDSSSTVDGAGAAVDGSTVTITEEGTYILSGTLKNGSVVVDLADENAKVQLVLNGVDITCSNGPAILVENADKVFITLADGSKNTLADGTSHDTGADGNDHDGVIFSHDDLTFNGSGSLTVTGNYMNGIVGKNDVRFTSGTYEINAVHHGIQGKDCVKILDGTFTITVGQDGIHGSNDEDDMLGYVGIGGGTFTIVADDDAIHADSALLVAGGTIDITKSYEGLEGRSVSVTGGDIKIVSSDDGLNAATGSEANDNQPFAGPGGQGGNGFQRGTDGQGGTQGTTPPSGGTQPNGSNSNNQVVDVSVDNAAATTVGTYSTSDQAETMQTAVTSSDVFLEITGGNLYVKAGGDGLDSNGNMTISGGDIIVECAASGGDGALDCDGTPIITGGTIGSVGPTDMAQGFAGTSTQASIMLNAQTANTAGKTLAVLDSSGKEVYSFTPTISNRSFVISFPGMVEGETYTVTSEGQTLGTATAALNTSNGGGMGGGMGNRGGRGF